MNFVYARIEEDKEYDLVQIIIESYLKDVKAIYQLLSRVKLRGKSLEWNHRQKIVRAKSSTSPFQNYQS